MRVIFPRYSLLLYILWSRARFNRGPICCILRWRYRVSLVSDLNSSIHTTALLCSNYARVRTQTIDLTSGIPIAVRSVLKGPAMLSFLSTLAEVVLPRAKDFEGIHFVQSEKSGSINFGFPPSAMSLFPQIEGRPPETDYLTISQLRLLQISTRFRCSDCDDGTNNS